MRLHAIYGGAPVCARVCIEEPAHKALRPSHPSRSCSALLRSSLFAANQDSRLSRVDQNEQRRLPGTPWAVLLPWPLSHGTLSGCWRVATQQPSGSRRDHRSRDAEKQKPWRSVANSVPTHQRTVLI